MRSSDLVSASVSLANGNYSPRSPDGRHSSVSGEDMMFMASHEGHRRRSTLALLDQSSASVSGDVTPTASQERRVSVLASNVVSPSLSESTRWSTACASPKMPAYEAYMAQYGSVDGDSVGRGRCRSEGLSGVTSPSRLTSFDSTTPTTNTRKARDSTIVCRSPPTLSSKSDRVKQVALRSQTRSLVASVLSRVERLSTQLRKPE